MKTAISVPDELFEQATKWAAALGIGRSAFFSRAAERYVEDLAAESLTDQINEALELAGGDDDSWSDAAEAGRRLLSDTEGEDW